MADLNFAYEGCKMALLTCSRTLVSYDGMEIKTKLFWAISELQKAIVYAMLFNTKDWKIEKGQEENNDETHNLPKGIDASKDMQVKAPFVKQYIKNEEERDKIDEIQNIRNYVNHANSKSLESEKYQIEYLKNLILLALNILVQITQCNHSTMTGNTQAEQMKNFVEVNKNQLSQEINHF